MKAGRRSRRRCASPTWWSPTFWGRCRAASEKTSAHFSRCSSPAWTRPLLSEWLYPGRLGTRARRRPTSPPQPGRFGTRARRRAVSSAHPGRLGTRARRRPTSPPQPGRLRTRARRRTTSPGHFEERPPASAHLARVESAQLGEPDTDLALGGLSGVRSMNDVLLDLQAPVTAEVAADRTRQRHGRVGGAGQGAEALDATLTLDDDSRHLAAGHELQQRLVERLARMLGVVLGQSAAVGGEDRQG